ncbi:MAG TPA: hypothetical protein VFA00_08970 [Actinomycetota bacterium]|nr:hypothetical protein [Actinomycetota bacterium]
MRGAALWNPITAVISRTAANTDFVRALIDRRAAGNWRCASLGADLPAALEVLERIGTAGDIMTFAAFLFSDLRGAIRAELFA